MKKTSTRTRYSNSYINLSLFHSFAIFQLFEKMEKWYDFIESYSNFETSTDDRDLFNKALNIGKTLLREDLADFEIDNFIRTLLLSPVCLLSKVSIKRDVESWSNSINKALKLITEVVNKCGDLIKDSYFRSICELCHLQYKTNIRANALDCLTAVAKYSHHAANNVHPELLENAFNKASTALLIGAICQNHPGTVQDKIQNFWRMFLRQLESRNTDKVTNAVLEGMYGVLKEFGWDLTQLDEFYFKMLNCFYEIPSCEQVCLNVFKDHAVLFREQFALDVKLREYLWSKLPKSADAVVNVYRQLKDKPNFKDIIQTEALPRVLANDAIEKYTARRVVFGVVNTSRYDDLHTIVYEINCGNTRDWVYEAAIWLLESNIPYCEKLVQACIKSYDLLPQKKRAILMQQALLSQNTHLRNISMKYLITAHCDPHQGDETKTEVHQIWRSVFECEPRNGLIQKSLLYKEMVFHTIQELSILDEDSNMPEQIRSLLHLTAHVIKIYDEQNAWYAHALKTRVSIAAAKSLLIACCNHEVNVDLTKILDLRRCLDEQSLSESCLSIVHAPSGVGLSSETVLTALQIIFSTKTVDPDSLIVSLKKLEALSPRNELDQNQLNDIYNKICNLQTKAHSSSKTERVLHRMKTQFLGKYVNRDFSSSVATYDKCLLNKCEIPFNILNTYDGVNYLVNLKRVLYLAIVQDEPGVLSSLLVLVRKHASQENIKELEMLLTVKLCSCHVRGEAVDLSLVELDDRSLQYLPRQISPGLRRMICDGLEELLTAPGFEGETLIDSIYEHAVNMLKSREVETKRAGIDLSTTLLNVLKNSTYHSLSIKILPDILKALSKTNESGSDIAFDIATVIVMDKIGLFDSDKSIIRQLIDAVLKNLSEYIAYDNDVEVETYKNKVGRFLVFSKEVFEVTDDDSVNILDVISNGCQLDVFYLLAEARDNCSVSTDDVNKFMDENLVIIDRGFSEFNFSEYAFRYESFLCFVTVYADVLLNRRYEEIKRFLSEIIQKLTPAILKRTHNTIKKCFDKYREELKTLPEQMIRSLKNLLSTLSLHTISKQLDNEYENPSDTTKNSLQFFKLIKQCFQDETLQIDTQAKEWPEKVLRKYATDSEGCRDNMSFLTDVLQVSLSFLTVQELRGIVSEGVGVGCLGVEFCRMFMVVFYDVLLKKRDVLLDESMEASSVVLKDVVEFNLRTNREEDVGVILELVNQLWPAYEKHSTFKEKTQLLLAISRFRESLSWDSNPMVWVTSIMTAPATKLEEKNELIRVLPFGSMRGKLVKEIVLSAPLCISEWKNAWRETLIAILDLLSTTGDVYVLEIVAKLADRESQSGFYDDQFKSCAKTLCDQERFCDRVFNHSLKAETELVVERLLLPILRASTRSFCEIFLSRRLLQLLKVMSSKQSSHVDRTKACLILGVAFVKLSKFNLESPSSVLYREVAAPSFTTTWYLAREVCKKSAAITQDMSTDVFDEKKRRMRCAVYNLVSSAILCWGVTMDAVFEFICSQLAFTGLMGPVNLPIRPSYNRRRHVSVVPLARNTSSMTSSRSTTLRSRTFLRTLSENAFRYDLTNEEDDQIEVQELDLPDNPLNRHECVAAMTAVICHLSQHKPQGGAWVTDLVAALRDMTRKEDRWLVSQVVINCREDLSPHASVISPALLKVIVDTTCESNAASTTAETDGELNDLHVNILSTVSFWGKSEEIDSSFSEDLNKGLALLVDTLMKSIPKQFVYRHLTEVLESFLKSFGDILILDDSITQKLLAKGIKPTPDQKKAQTSILNIILRLLNHKINLKALLPEIKSIMNTKEWTGFKMAEVFGAAMTVDTDVNVKSEALTAFSQLLERTKENLNNFVAYLFYAQKYYGEVCDERYFRFIADKVPKIESSIKKKCLKIIACYIRTHNSKFTCEMFDNIAICELIISSEYAVEALAVVDSGFRNLGDRLKGRVEGLLPDLCLNPEEHQRRAALVVVGVFLKETLQSGIDLEGPSAKKPKSSSSAILCRLNSSRLLGAMAVGAIDKVESIASMCQEVLNEYLSKDLYVRYIECLYLMELIQSCLAKDCIDMAASVAAILDLLFSEIRDTDTWKKLSIELKKKITSVNHQSGSKVLTNSRTYQGSFSRSNAKIQQQTKDVQENTVFMVEDIWRSLVNFAQKDIIAARSLFQTTTEAIVSRSNTAIDSDLLSTVARLLTMTTHLTPLTVDICRTLIKKGYDCSGLQSEINKLYCKTKDGAGFEAVVLLHEEMMVKYGGYEYFSLGIPREEEMTMDHIYSTQVPFLMRTDLTAVFGRLSNWENLTIQRKQSILASGLPRLWPSKQEVVTYLDNYNTNSVEDFSWFEAMVLGYKDDSCLHLEALKLLRKPVLKNFEKSAIMEALDWMSSRTLVEDDCQYQLPCNFAASDCLAEWATRLFVRTAFLSKLKDIDSNDENTTSIRSMMLSRSHELKWCERANEIGLHSLVKQCVKRNADSDFMSNELLPWHFENVLSLHLEGVQDKHELRTSLVTMKNEYKNNVNDVNILIKTNTLITELTTADETSLEDLRNMVLETHSFRCDSINKSNILKFDEAALRFYNCLCTDHHLTKDYLSHMCDIVCHIHEVTSKPSVCYADLLLVLMENLANSPYPERLAAVFRKLQPLLPRLDDCALQYLRKLASRLPWKLEDSILRDLEPRLSTHNTALWLQLVRDASYTLMQYCDALKYDLLKEDEMKWKKDFMNMKRVVFENEFAGEDYQLLIKYKKNLYKLENVFDSTDATDRQKAKETLQMILESLSRSNARPTLLLSQLCPRLAMNLENDQGLTKLLNLPDGITVVNFEKQVKVYVDSIRRPVVLRARLSNGRTKTYIHKTGEPLRKDAAAQRIAKLMSDFGLKSTYYNVTVLHEDSALIEYLEDHQRLKGIIESDARSVVNLNVGPANDEELILSSTATLIGRYEQYCKTTPANALRTAIERDSPTLEDFVMRKSNFQDSLAVMSIISWILGLADRHLNNIMMDTTGGSVCCVDWGSLFEYELPPARLTRNLLAVCDLTVLECRLQQTLGLLRNSKQAFFMAAMTVAVDTLEDTYKDKLTYVRNIVAGKMLPHEVTCDVLTKSPIPNKEHYVALLNRTFEEHQKKDVYDVQEQVTCLLRQCTAPEILGAMRRGWEPWL